MDEVRIPYIEKTMLSRAPKHHKLNGKLVGMEMALNDDIDRCDIMFSDFNMYKGLQIPRKIEVRHGNQLFATLEVKNFEIKNPTVKKP